MIDNYDDSPNEYGFLEIADSSLMLTDVPPADSRDWRAIVRFALSYDGYRRCGSFGKCANTANDSRRRWENSGDLPNTLSALRASLFFETRRQRIFQEQPDDQMITYAVAIIGAIRQILKSVIDQGAWLKR